MEKVQIKKVITGVGLSMALLVSSAPVLGTVGVMNTAYAAETLPGTNITYSDIYRMIQPGYSIEKQLNFDPIAQGATYTYFDNVYDPDITVNSKGEVFEIHRTKSGGAAYYNTGTIVEDEIVWNNYDKIKGRSIGTKLNDLSGGVATWLNDDQVLIVQSNTDKSDAYNYKYGIVYSIVTMKNGMVYGFDVKEEDIFGGSSKIIHPDNVSFTKDGKLFLGTDKDYAVGTIASENGEITGINWSGKYTLVNDGDSKDTTVDITRSGKLVEIHVKDTNKLYYSVGQLLDDNTIQWDFQNKHMAFNIDEPYSLGLTTYDGTHPAVVLTDDGTFVMANYAPESGDPLVYRAGFLSENGEIEWNSSGTYSHTAPTGDPAITLKKISNERIIEIHQGDGGVFSGTSKGVYSIWDRDLDMPLQELGSTGNSIYFKIGQRNSLYPNITYELIRDEGTEHEEMIQITSELLFNTNGFYRDEGLELDSEHTYVVRATDWAGTERRSEVVTAKTSNILIPQMTFFPTEQSEQNTIRLAWMPPATEDVDIVKYELYREDISDNEPYQVFENDSTEFIVNGFEDSLLPMDTTLKYKIRAIDSDGNASEMSDVIQINTKNLLTKNVQITGVNFADGVVRIGWITPETAGIAIDSVEVIREDLQSGEMVSFIIPSDSPEFNQGGYVDHDVDLHNVEYKYTMKVLDKAGNRSEQSNAMTVTTLSPVDITKVYNDVDTNVVVELNMQSPSTQLGNVYIEWEKKDLNGNWVDQKRDVVRSPYGYVFQGEYGTDYRVKVILEPSDGNGSTYESYYEYLTMPTQ
ncbi:fibronectin type III domain-containing protein [Chengkuizengella marina]|uniref:Fibronectin type III domain-containing protein n=1 Tax=Chengkuizengella marina TaxID=2507566 RepID=A0A6N9Q679_9BACL|nr:fibronectin type III domain-containing protein [Chengkuizengella marina]NBI30201.1 fibronectin type III domain-containing protein [Chengkuizengella marina]